MPRRWRTRSPSGCRRLRRCRSPTNAPILPTQPLAKAQALADYLAAKAAATTPLLGADQVVADLGDGHAALRPAVHLLAEPDVDMLNIELRFSVRVGVAVVARRRHRSACATRWSSTPSPSDEELIDDLLAEPSITNVYRGHHPTYYTAPGIPHDGFLADFLMRCKGFVRGLPTAPSGAG